MYKTIQIILMLWFVIISGAADDPMGLDSEGPFSPVVLDKSILPSKRSTEADDSSEKRRRTIEPGVTIKEARGLLFSGRIESSRLITWHEHEGDAKKPLFYPVLSQVLEDGQFCFTLNPKSLEEFLEGRPISGNPRITFDVFGEFPVADADYLGFPHEMNRQYGTSAENFKKIASCSPDNPMKYSLNFVFNPGIDRNSIFFDQSNKELHLGSKYDAADVFMLTMADQVRRGGYMHAICPRSGRIYYLPNDHCLQNGFVNFIPFEHQVMSMYDAIMIDQL